MDDLDYITGQNLRYSRFHRLRNLFFESLAAAELNWFFVQGYDAYNQQLYLPALSCLLNGVEATLRVTLHQDDGRGAGNAKDVSPYKVLSNRLILEGGRQGLPVTALAFEEKWDFEAKLATQKPDRRDVEVVRLRNNVCHGNIMEFVDFSLRSENSFFAPDALKPKVEQLLSISARWCVALCEYRLGKGLRNHGRSSPDQPEAASPIS